MLTPELWKGLLACLCLLQFGKMMLNRVLAGLQEVSLWYGWFSKAKGLGWQEVEEAERFGVVEGLFKVCL